MTQLGYLNLNNNPFQEPLRTFLELDIMWKDNISVAKAVVQFMREIENKAEAAIFDLKVSSEETPIAPALLTLESTDPAIYSADFYNPRLVEICKGFLLLLVLIYTIPFILGTLVEVGYLKRLTQRFPALHTVWGLYDPTKHAPTSLLGYWCNMQFPLRIKEPLESVGFIRRFLRMLARMLHLA